MSSVAEKIRDRAAAIRQLGEYIGTFEFLAFSELKQFNVKLYVGCIDGCGVTDIREVFALGLGPLEKPLGDCHVVGCRVTDDCFGLGLPYMIDGLPQFNHWVIGVPLTEPSPGVSSIKGVDVFKVVMASAGIAIIETQALGDCGLDVLSHTLALPRNAATFKKLRSEIADFMVLVAESALWQDIWVACEGAPGIEDLAAADGASAFAPPLASLGEPLLDTAIKDSSVLVASVDSHLALVAPMASAQAPSASAQAPSASAVSASAHASSPPSPIALAEPSSADDPGVALADELVADPEPSLDKGEQLSEQQKAETVKCFREHLLSLDKDELMKITGSFEEFKAVEAFCHTRPRKAYIRT